LFVERRDRWFTEQVLAHNFFSCFANLLPQNLFVWAVKMLPPISYLNKPIMFTPARDFLLETPWRIIIPNPNVNSHSL
jgi:hypothetical protein